MKYYLLSFLILVVVSCEFQKGDLNKDNCVVLPEGENDICDFYYLDIDRDEIVASDVYGCTRYIDCFGATTLELKIPIMVGRANVGVVFYDNNRRVLPPR